MKKLAILLCTITFMGNLAANATCPCKTDTTVDTTNSETAKPCSDVPEEKPCRCRLTQTELYKKLCLDQCQIDKASCLFNKYKSEAKEIKEALKCEKNKLCQMIQSCAASCEIKEQKAKIKDLKHALKEKWNCYDEQLKEIFTTQQLKEFKAIKKQEKARCKKFRKNDCCK